MSHYRVKITGLKEVTEMYKLAPERTIRFTQVALQESGDVLVENTIRKIKAKKLVDRGKLSQMTRTYPAGPLQQIVEVYTNYAVGLEDGSPPHMPPINALKGWAKRKLGNENLAYVVAKAIAKKGIKARHFHQEAIEISLSDFDRIFGEELFNKIYNV